MLFVVHAAGSGGAIEFAFKSAQMDEFLWYRRDWDAKHIRGLSRRIFDEMGSPEIDAGWKGFDEPPAYSNRSLPAVKRIMKNCAAMTEALLPEEIANTLFLGQESARLLLSVTLSLHFIPWDLLSDGEQFLIERHEVVKVIL